VSPTLTPPEVVTPWAVQHRVVALWFGWSPNYAKALREGDSSPGLRELLQVREVFGWSLDAQGDAYLAGDYPAWFDHYVRQYAATLPTAPCACGCGIVFPGRKWGHPHNLNWLSARVREAMRTDSGPALRAQIEVEHPEMLDSFDRMLWHRQALARGADLRKRGFKA